MKVVFCAYADINYRARELEELKCLESIGQVDIVTSVYPQSVADNTCVHAVRKRSYRAFVGLSKDVIKRVRPDLVFLHDNYCACLIPYVKKYSPKSAIVYDMSELYIGKQGGKTPPLAAQWLQKQEYEHLADADLVLAANEERAAIAKGYFGLKDYPFVFDNIHRITEEYDADDCYAKYSRILDKTSFTLLYAGGLSQSGTRGTDSLIKAMSELGPDFKLVIAGQDTKDSALKKTINESRWGNVHYVGKIKRTELRYLYQNADLNIVTFDDSSINNIFCASGKLYEGMFEGLPVLASPNPPIKKLCDNWNVGQTLEDMSVGSFVSGIRLSQEFNELQKRNVTGFCDQLESVDRIGSLKQELLITIAEKEAAN